MPQEHHSPHSAWETPDPGFWTRNGYALVRADEVGLGQSPGIMDTMSRSTSECFFDVVEWAAEQPWSSGKVGLLGISYYAGSQWRVAARQPKGLACIIPWEGMSDYYRDRCRHGGIYSNTFIKFWWDRQVSPSCRPVSRRSIDLLFPRSSLINMDAPAEQLEIGDPTLWKETSQEMSCGETDTIRLSTMLQIISWTMHIIHHEITIWLISKYLCSR